MTVSSAAVTGLPDDHPLSVVQEQLLFHHDLHAADASYHVPVRVRLRGPLDRDALGAALALVAGRHASLRSTFVVAHGDPVQRVWPTISIDLPHHDLRALEPRARTEAASALVEDAICRPFALATEPPIRAVLIQTEDAEHQLVLTVHHIAADGWALGVICRELGVAYAARRGGEDPALPPVDVQFFSVARPTDQDVARWERDLQYWKKRLAGAPMVLDLPLDRPRPRVSSRRGAHYGVRLPRELAEKVVSLCRAERVTPFVALLTVFQALLFRYTGMPELLVATAVANRNRRSLERVVGTFVNLVVLRAELGSRPTFREALATTRARLFESIEHASVPFERVVGALSPPRSLAHEPLCQALFQLEGSPATGLSLEGLEVESLPMENHRSRFDLLVSLWEQDGGVEGFWEYSTELFDEATIAQLARHYETMLRALVAEPALRVDEVDLLDDHDKQTLLRDWNRTARPYPRDATVPELFEQEARRRPDATAVLCGQHHLTYAELDRRANQLAHHLRHAGVRDGERVGLCVPRSIERIVAVLAILKAGAAYVPLEPSYPPARTEQMLADAAARVILSDDAAATALTTGGRTVIALGRDAALIEAHDTERLARTDSPLSEAYVMYTSGSTGHPKGVAVPHRAIVRLVREPGFATFDENERVAHFAPIGFDAATLELWAPLLNGGTACVLAPGELSLRQIADELRALAVTTLWLTAPLFREMVDQELEAFAGLRQLIAGGDVVPMAQTRALKRRFPALRFVNGYGPTENTTFTACHTVLDADLDRTAVPIGRPIANTTVYLLDPNLRPVPIGVAGELYTGGDGLALGYVQNAQATAERFLRDPFSDDPEARIYRTGDLARYRRDGVLEYLGRADLQVKIRGHRVELGEIEAALSAHPEVRDAAVVARLDPGGDKRLDAYVVADPRFDLDALRAQLRERLPPHMLPASITLLGDLPRTPTGKLDRRALPEPQRTHAESRPHVAPTTATERELLHLWGRVLGTHGFGVTDDFFESGGQSLTALRLVARIRETFGRELSLRTVFERPTVRELAEAIDALPRADDGPPLARLDRERAGGRFPLSSAQQRLWFFTQQHPRSAIYNMPFALSLHGRVDIAALRTSLEQIVLRHEVLRTTYELAGEQPVQHVLADREWKLPWTEHDLRSLSPEAREAQIARITADEAEQPFALDRELPIRARLLRTADDAFRLLVTIHHIAADAWSIGLLLGELGALYSAAVDGKGAPPSVVDLPFQYVDYADWQRRRLSPEVLATQLAFWTDELRGAPPLLELPLDHPRPPVRDHRGHHLRSSLPPDLARALAAAAREHGATLFLTMLAGFYALLHRYTGQHDMVVGTPTANRLRRDLEALVGFFINVVPVRADVSGRPSLRELVERVRTSALRAYEHAEVPYERVVEALNPARSLSYEPLCQVVFQLQSEALPDPALLGLRASLLDVTSSGAKFDLLVSFRHHDDRLEGFWEYSTELFDEATIAQLARHYETMLRALVAEPALRVDEVDLLDDHDKQTLLRDWNRTARPYPRDATVPELFEQEARRRPHAIAVLCGQRQLTYAELDRCANQLAHHLRHAGVRDGERVGLSVPRSIDRIVAVLAILKAGAAYVPVKATPRERAEHMLSDASVRVIVADDVAADLLVGEGREIVALGRDTRAIAARATERPATAARALSEAYVMYTSGSTGRPKGVAVTHRGVVRLVRESGFATFDENERVGHLAPMGFDLSTFEIWAPLLNGGTACVLAPGELTLREIADELRALAVTTLWLTAPLFREMVDQELEALGGLRQLVAGGDVVPMAQTRALKRRFPALRFINGYGPTENTTFTTCHTVVETDLDRSSVPIGRPIGNTTVYLLDANLRPVPIGVTGELYTGGDGLALGYVQNAQATTERFLPDPFSEDPEARIYRTGDLARYRRDGVLEYLGRADLQVKVRGHRVELGEIEAALAAHPEVRDAAVVARLDPGGDKRLDAYVVADPHFDVDALWAHLARTLPLYMVPGSLTVLDAFPKTSSGKVDRRALPERPRGHGRQRVEPASQTEHRLLETWASLLGSEELGVTDDFFRSGGHSLTAIRLMVRIRETFGRELSLRTVFERPTVRELAEAIDALPRAHDAAPLARLDRERGGGRFPLSSAQQRLWFFTQQNPRSAIYNMPFALSLHGRLDVAALRRSLEQIVLRHEVLRTTYELAGEQPVQHVHADREWKLPWTEHDLLSLSLSPEARDAQIARITADEAEHPFALDRELPIRARLLRIADDAFRLLVTIHHIAADAWSIGLLLGELGALYSAALDGKAAPPSVVDLPFQYADYADWQRRRLSPEILATQLAFWTDELRGAPPLLELPLDHPRPPVRDHRGHHLRSSLPPDLARALTAAAREHGATLFLTMLAGFYALLHRYTGQHDMVVGTPTANRLHRDLEALVGFFINIVPVRADVSGRPSLRKLLDRVRTSALRAYEHAEVPYERVVEALNPARSLSYEPLCQVVFQLQSEGVPDPALLGLRASLLDVTSAGAKFDLLVSFRHHDDRIEGFWEYSTELFDEATIAQLARHYETMLRALVAEPALRVDEVDLLDDHDKQTLLRDWNRTARPYPRDATVPELFEQEARRRPQAIAVVCGDRQLTYAGLDRRANQLAHHLRHAGVRDGERVGLCVPRSIERIVAVLAILKAGAAYVPLEASYPPARTEQMLADAAARVIVSDDAAATALTTGGRTVVALGRDAALIEAHDTERLARTDSPLSEAYVMYTSGSTGHPKGVAVPHRAIVRLVREPGFATFDENERVAHFAPIGFDAATLELWAPLLNGGTACVLAPGELTLRQIADELRALAVTTLWLTAPLFREMVDQELEAFAGLRQLIAGGDVVPMAQTRALKRRFPALRFVNGYGPTENTTFTACHTVVETDLDRTSVPIGRPIANTTVYLLDPNLRPVPIGVAGELYTGGDGLALGYVQNAQATAERFLRDPFSDDPGARIYRTGDLARYRRDGVLEYLGRADLQVKIRGHRVELGEIEAALAAHPEVRDAAVVARVDSGGDKRLDAYVVADPRFDLDALRARLREQLPPHMLPASITLLGDLPRTPTGKLDRRALPEPAAKSSSTAPFVEPAGPIEERLARLWAELLGLPRVSVEASFFDLGGHSLLLMRLDARVREEYGKGIPALEFFLRPTIRGLAPHLPLEREHERERERGADASFVELGGDFAALLGDAVPALSPSLEPRSASASPAARAGSDIVVTGATGFLGVHLVDELLRTTTQTIHCLVRAKDDADARQRIQQAAARFDCKIDLGSRVIAVAADLEQDKLGLGSKHYDALAGRIGSIVHAAARVNHVYPYALLRDANVLGTVRIARLASDAGRARLHFVSTQSVFDAEAYAASERLREDDPLAHPPELTHGYARTKWASERVLHVARERGLPVTVSRPGWIAGHRATGACNVNDHVWRILQGCLELGCAPESDRMLTLSTVDDVARRVVAIASEGGSRSVHLPPTHRVPWTAVLDELAQQGVSLARVSDAEWRRTALADRRANSALAPLVDAIERSRSIVPSFDRRRLHFTATGSEGVDAPAPANVPTAAELVAGMVAFLLRGAASGAFCTTRSAQ